MKMKLCALVTALAVAAPALTDASSAVRRPKPKRKRVYKIYTPEEIKRIDEESLGHDRYYDDRMLKKTPQPTEVMSLPPTETPTKYPTDMPTDEETKKPKETPAPSPAPTDEETKKPEETPAPTPAPADEETNAPKEMSDAPTPAPQQVATTTASPVVISEEDGEEVPAVPPSASPVDVPVVWVVETPSPTEGVKVDTGSPTLKATTIAPVTAEPTTPMPVVEEEETESPVAPTPAPVTPDRVEGAGPVVMEVQPSGAMTLGITLSALAVACTVFFV